jgi:hypothetical protein
MEEIEEFYKREVEKAEIEFLDALKTGKVSREELEKKYKERLALAKKRYEELNLKFINEQKKIKPKKPKKTKEKAERFIVKHLNLKLTRRERLKLRYDFAVFRLKIITRDFFQGVVPTSLALWYIKKKRNARQNSGKFSNYIRAVYSEFIEAVYDFFKYIGSIALKIYSNTKSFAVGLKGRVSEAIKNIREKRKKLEEEKKQKQEKKVEEKPEAVQVKTAEEAGEDGSKSENTGRSEKTAEKAEKEKG